MVLALPLLCGGALRADEWAAVPTDSGETPAVELPVVVRLDDPRVKYTGRFDRSDPKQAVCSWPASAVTLIFRGAAINAAVGAGANRILVILDGVPLKKLTGDPAAKGAAAVRWYRLADGLGDGPHKVTLFKATEPNVGNASFAGFQLAAGGVPSGQVFRGGLPRLRIEAIGDSITAGYGNEAANKEQHFSPETENAYWTAGAIAARELQADFTCIAWSGRTMWPTFTIPEIYDRTLPQTAEPKWPAGADPADVYVIDLATNEFGRKENPDEEGWVKAYKDFVAKLRASAPNALIYCASSPMMNDAWPPERHARSTAIRYLKRVVGESNAAGDNRVKFLEYDEQNGTVTGLGADWHPNVKTNQKMAAKLVAAIKSDLKDRFPNAPTVKN